MRKVQVSISVEIYNEEAEKRFNGYEPISVYADANTVWEALWAGVDEVLTVLKENGRTLPSFGSKEHMPTVELKERKVRRQEITGFIEKARTQEKNTEKISAKES